MNKKIVLIVLIYRPNRNVLEVLLRSLSGWPVIVVDNTPGRTQSFLRQQTQNVTVISNRQNLGYTGGMNIGIKKALSEGAEWVVLLNDDVKLNKSDIDKLGRTLTQARPAIIGPFPGRLDKLRWTTVYPAADRSHFDYLSGSFLAIHKNVIEKIGLFYEPYFIYYEDVELCLRAKRVGFPLVYIDLIHLKHRDGTTFGKGSLTQEYYLARNHLLFVERNAPALVKLHEYLRLPKTVAEHLLHKNWGALLGLKDYFLRRFGIFKR